MTKQSATNASPLMQAAYEIRKGVSYAESGAARLTIGLADAMDSPLSYKVGDDSFAFTLLDYRQPIMNDDRVTKSGKHQNARLTAIMSELLGEDPKDISNAVKTAFNKCYPAAVLIRLNPDFHKITVKGGHLSNIPLPLAIDLDSATVQKRVLQGVRAAGQLANEEYTDEQALAKAYGMKVDASGGAHTLFGKLPTSPQMIATLGALAEKRGLVARKEERAPREPAKDAGDNAKRLSDALDWVNEMITEQYEGDEATIAFTTEIEAKTMTLWLTLSKYLEAQELV